MATTVVVDVAGRRGALASVTRTCSPEGPACRWRRCGGPSRALATLNMTSIFAAGPSGLHVRGHRTPRRLGGRLHPRRRWLPSAAHLARSFSFTSNSSCRAGGSTRRRERASLRHQEESCCPRGPAVLRRAPHPDPLRRCEGEGTVAGRAQTVRPEVRRGGLLDRESRRFHDLDSVPPAYRTSAGWTSSVSSPKSFVCHWCVGRTGFTVGPATRLARLGGADDLVGELAAIRRRSRAEAYRSSPSTCRARRRNRAALFELPQRPYYHLAYRTELLRHLDVRSAQRKGPVARRARATINAARRACTLCAARPSSRCTSFRPSPTIGPGNSRRASRRPPSPRAMRRA